MTDRTKFKQQRINWLQSQIDKIDTDYDKQGWWIARANQQRMVHLHNEMRILNTP